MTLPPDSPGQRSYRRKPCRRGGLHTQVVDQSGQMIVTGDSLTEAPSAPTTLFERIATNDSAPHAIALVPEVDNR